MRRISNNLVLERRGLVVRVDLLFAEHGDFEGAHTEEDSIREDTLRLISEFGGVGSGSEWIREAADNALRTSEIDFPRRCG